MSVNSVSGISPNQISKLSGTFVQLAQQVGYAQDVQTVLQKAISFVDDDYLRAVFTLMNEMVSAKVDATNTYVSFNNQITDIKLDAIQNQLIPEIGNYILKAYA